MKVKEESEKVGLKLNIQKSKIMTSSPYHFMADRWGNSENTDFILGGSQITAYGDCSHEIKRHLLFVRKIMTNRDSIIKSRDITLPTKVHLVRAIVFPVVMYGCESWTIKKAEHWRTDAFELCCWRRLLRVPWTARRSNQSNSVCIMPGFPVHHQLLELAQTHVHRVSDAIQPFHSLLSLSPPAFNLSQHQGLFQWVSSSHQVVKVLEFQLHISASNEYSGLISFRIDWFDVLAVQGTLKSLLQHHSSKSSILQHSAFFIVRLSHPYMTGKKT